MAISGTLCILRTSDGSHDFLMTEHKGLPYVLWLRDSGPEFIDSQQATIADAVRFLTAHDDIEEISIPGVGRIVLAMW